MSSSCSWAAASSAWAAASAVIADDHRQVVEEARSQDLGQAGATVRGRQPWADNPAGASSSRATYRASREHVDAGEPTGSVGSVSGLNRTQQLA